MRSSGPINRLAAAATANSGGAKRSLRQASILTRGSWDHTNNHRPGACMRGIINDVLSRLPWSISKNGTAPTARPHGFRGRFSLRDGARHRDPSTKTGRTRAFGCEFALFVRQPEGPSSSDRPSLILTTAKGPTQPLNPPFPTPLPLWLALLLKKQKRANISPPPWLSVEDLSHILDFETDTRTAEVFSPSPALPPATGVSSSHGEYLAPESTDFSPPFLANSSTSRAQVDALPYHWLEVGHLLLTHASDDFDDPDAVRRLLRDLREVRMSKLRKGFKILDAGAGVKLNGVGGMEIAEVRGFVEGVVDGLR